MSTSQRQALHAIAAFEALKGVAALAALMGLIDLMHQDVRGLAMALIGRFGLDPEAHYPSLLLHYADLLPDADLAAIFKLGLAYVSIRFAEAYGLWRGARWGEYLGAISGGIYIPLEMQHLLKSPSWTTACVTLLNLVIVAYLVHVLWHKRGLPAQDAP